MECLLFKICTIFNGKLINEVTNYRGLPLRLALPPSNLVSRTTMRHLRQNLLLGRWTMQIVVLVFYKGKKSYAGMLVVILYKLSK